VIHVSSYTVRWKAYFDILNRLDVTHKCDGRTDGHYHSKFYA